METMPGSLDLYKYWIPSHIKHLMAHDIHCRYLDIKTIALSLILWNFEKIAEVLTELERAQLVSLLKKIGRHAHSLKPF